MAEIEKLYEVFKGAQNPCRTNLTPERIKKAIDLKQKGLNLREIGEALGNSQNPGKPLDAKGVRRLLNAPEEDARTHRNALRRKRYRMKKGG